MFGQLDNTLGPHIIQDCAKPFRRSWSSTLLELFLVQHCARPWYTSSFESDWTIFLICPKSAAFHKRKQKWAQKFSFLYYVSVCIRNSQKVCVDVLGGFCFVFKMPPNWANNIKMRMACGSLNGCELNSHLSSALCTAALLSIYYVVCRLKESCKKIFLVF